jgi:heme o synthase
MKHLPTIAKVFRKPVHWHTTISDYISLTKPRIVLLLLLTTLVTMLLTDASGLLLERIVWTLLGGYFAASGAGALNCALEADIDRMMDRTGKRPVAAGRIAPHHAFRCGILLSLLAFIILANKTTLTAALLAILGVIYYVLIYTHWLKRRTWLNIVIGGGAGAMPPLVGSAAATGTLTSLSLLLAALIFLWSPPHFWSLALFRQKEYTRAGIPMLPVVAGQKKTRKHIIAYSIGTAILSLLLTPLSTIGLSYFILALPLNGLFIAKAWRVYQTTDLETTRSFFKYTILYLAFLFLAMIIDKIVMNFV